LTGTIAENQRPGYVRIDFPASEQWKTILSNCPFTSQQNETASLLPSRPKKKSPARLATLANKPKLPRNPITTTAQFLHPNTLPNSQTPNSKTSAKLI